MAKLTALIGSLRTAIALHESRFGGIDAADQLAQMIWFVSHDQHIGPISELLKNLNKEPWATRATAVPIEGLAEWTKEFRKALHDSRTSDTSSVGLRPEVAGLYRTLLGAVDGGARHRK